MLSEQDVKELTYQTLTEAAKKYENVPHVEIKFFDTLFDKCTLAGQAEWNDGLYSINYSREAISKNPDTFHRTVIIHEAAHIVAIANYGNNTHNKQWKKICKDLGGDGERCYRNKLTPRHIHKYFKYVLDSGLEFWLGFNKHKKVQKGEHWCTLKEKQSIRKKHFTGVIATRLDIDIEIY